MTVCSAASDKENYVDLLVEKYPGGIKKLSELFGITTKAISKWRKAGVFPSHRCEAAAQLLNSVQVKVTKQLLMEQVRQTPLLHK